MTRFRPLLLLTLLALLTAAPATAKPKSKMPLGWIEPVLLDPRLGLKIEAKLDTGADTSSLDAHHIRRVRAGEKRYVRFSVRHPETGELVELRKPYIRRVRIKRHGGAYQRRYVIRMQVCIGSRTRSIEVNLIDRNEFEYPMLLGRSALKGWSTVDPEATHQTEPVCWNQPGSEPDDDAPNPPDDDGNDTAVTPVAAKPDVDTPNPPNNDGAPIADETRPMKKKASSE